MSSFGLFLCKWYIEKQEFWSVGQIISLISDKYYVGQVGCQKTGLTTENWEPGFHKKHL